MQGGTVAAFSRGRPKGSGENQDAAALLELDSQTGFIAVADGVGGSRSGAKAARMLLENLAKSWQPKPADSVLRRATMISGIEHANQEILALGTGAATTLALVLIEEKKIKPIHIGDSSILVVGRRGRIKHQNISHGPVGYGLEAGLINELQAMKHEQRHIVSNYVGTSEMRIEVGPSVELSPNDTVLISSDGLTDNLYLGEIVKCIRKGPIADAAQSLIEACTKRMSPPEVQGSEIPSKPDDLSFVIFRLSQ
ncbi:MAG: serine/threonine-protein phosphatase [Myxococcales bacterium]|nr:MAG: serine/threonine-protein phosphatase [Myxococcales bacterium]